MLHLIRYRFKQTAREKSTMFWALAFPFILAFFFYISFGSGDVMGEDMDPIKVALVGEETQTTGSQAFVKFLETMDGDTIHLEKMDKTAAIKKLKSDSVEGIFYVRETPSLTVARSDLNQSILKSLLDNYNHNANMVSDIMEQRPQKLEEALAAMENWEGATREVSLGGSTTDPNVSYFFALIAYACMSGSFLGVSASSQGQANLSALGARRSVTPTHKLKLILIDLLVVVTIQFVNVSLLSLFVQFVLGVQLGNDPWSMVLTNLLGSIIGVSIGVAIGCVSKVSENVRMGLTVLFTLFPGFLAGLMMGNMKDIIEHNAPIINRINPAAVLSDAYYSLGVYNDTERFMQNIVLLGVMSTVLILIAFLGVRRERYDSI